MLSWRVTFYIGSVHPLQAVPFSDFWTDLQQDSFPKLSDFPPEVQPFPKQESILLEGIFHLYCASVIKQAHREELFLRKLEVSLHYVPAICKTKRNAANFPVPNVPADY